MAEKILKGYSDPDNESSNPRQLEKCPWCGTPLDDQSYSCSKTENQQKLVQYYSNAHVLINPTHEDNYPTVNLEAIACGTPVITYDVGGSPESITPETGIVIPENDIIFMAKAIQSIQPNRAMCRKHAEECFSDKLMAEKYFDLYQNI